ncbi:MAG: rRNA maturation RNase YbeY [Nitrospinae bacterium]|nr:rRNA maturation RNase YbeY [Nitrospinota bacterium]
MTVLLRNEQRKHKVDSRALKARTQKILDGLHCPDDEVSILLVNDAKIRKLNARYRNIDSATDVLSFPQEDDPAGEMGFRLLGDVVVSLETARPQAKEHRLSLEEELILLIIHGILHLSGMDHERSAQEARRMRQKTARLFGNIFPGRKPGGTCAY